MLLWPCVLLSERGEVTVFEDEEKRELLRVARESIESVFRNTVPVMSEKHGRLTERRGVFVTLREGKELRGCIGYVEPRLPLVRAVAEVARKAAFEDPRFPSLDPDELPLTDIEISILSLLEEVRNVEEIEVGKHGLVLEAGMLKGLLLPHVPVEYGWDREQFLNHTALKAGLPPDAWQHDRARLFRFTTETFSETELYQPHQPR
ncbi:MAG: AmmeMemoRadiSam system protein A [Ignavibacteriales bacterium]|nr:AmmeMemoRadiSam system protein A [Ignavibacteriales bacterium]